VSHSVQVTIFNQVFTLRSRLQAEEVLAAADLVNEKIEEVRSSGRSADTLHTAVLALMNIAGSLLQQRTENEQMEQKVGQLLRQLPPSRDPL